MGSSLFVSVDLVVKWFCFEYIVIYIGVNGFKNRGRESRIIDNLKIEKNLYLYEFERRVEVDGRRIFYSVFEIYK